MSAYLASGPQIAYLKRLLNELEGFKQAATTLQAQLDAKSVAAYDWKQQAEVIQLRLADARQEIERLKAELHKALDSQKYMRDTEGK